MNINIGGFDWLVIFEKLDGDLGVTDFTNLTISVHNDMDEMVRKTVLLHEVMHACLFIAGIGESRYSEETFVSMTSPLLLTTLLNNEELRVALLS